MVKWVIILFFSLVLLACNEKKDALLDVKILPGYPSASGVTYIDGELFIIGDDASSILVTDLHFKVIDSIPLFPYSRRIPKEVKADIEGLTSISVKHKKYLLLVASGSLSPQRDQCWIIDPRNREIQQYSLDTFFTRLKKAGVLDVNVEAAAEVPGGILLANRGNRAYAKNQLVFTPGSFYLDQDSAGIMLVKAGTNTDTSFFNGISGMDYSNRSDKLYLSVSTENTFSSLADGDIGHSYIWIINDLNQRKKITAVNPDRMINLTEMDKRFSGHKIESLCIIRETRNEAELVLVSDDDKGGSGLFRVIIQK
jgi:hypothetical protein